MMKNTEKFIEKNTGKFIEKNADKTAEKTTKKYEVIDGIIYVYDKENFTPEHTLECGQVFRYGLDEIGNYFVLSNRFKATIFDEETHYKIVSNNPEYFVNYFDLNTDYSKIKALLKSNKIIGKMIDFGYGIRILKADTEEMIFSFIISQNNNIKRIKKIVEKLCEVGDEINDENGSYKAFPSSQILSKQPMEFFESLGAGYRASFLKETADFLATQNLDEIKKLSTDEILEYLMQIKGIGPKVASCALLFGFGRMEKFPVDTWLEKVYYNHFSSEKRTRPQIQEFFENEFKEYSGIAQQYLFYYEMNNQKK